MLDQGPPSLEEIIKVKPSPVVAPPKEEVSNKNPLAPPKRQESTEIIDTSAKKPAEKVTSTENNDSLGQILKKKEESTKNNVVLSNEIDGRPIVIKKSKTNFRRNSAIYPSLNKKLMLQTAKDQGNKKDILPSTREALEANKDLQELQWKLEIALNDKINSLSKELNDILSQIEEKKEDILSETKVFERRKKNLINQIQKEEKQNFELHQSLNTDLKKQKKKLLDEIENIEKQREEIKRRTKEKFNQMMILRQNLKVSVDQIDIIKNEILSRKFSLNDNSIMFDQSQSEDFIKLDSQESIAPNNINIFDKDLISSDKANLSIISAPIKQANLSIIKKDIQNNSMN